MFYFYADKDGELEISKGSVKLRSKRMFSDLTAARSKAHERILVIDTKAVPASESEIRSTETSLREALNDELPKAIHIPVSSIRNLSPYYPPDEVMAGGGLVTKMKKGSLRVLVIFRKGVWDLPKGKMDPGETIEHCARREVMEETGIGDLTVVQPLDFTLHGYVRNNRFKVKNTGWYEMRTEQKSFKPQLEEGIEEVKWMKWDKAESRLGYKMLQHLLIRTRHLIKFQGSSGRSEKTGKARKAGKAGK
jgi:8-oxo-(d)GTP phosphatase